MVLPADGIYVDPLILVRRENFPGANPNYFFFTGRCQPCLWTCGTRLNTSSLSAILRVTVVPAAIVTPLPYRDWRHQLGIRADKDIIANNRFMLVRTIVVAGDGARADIDVIANLRIAQIGQMTRLGAFPRRAFFISTKLPTWAPSSSSAPGRRRANGPMVQAACSWASSTTL